MIKKIPKDEYYLKIAETVAIKSRCLSVAFGCIVVKDDQIISTGYVGAPRKTMDCIELGYCIRRKKMIKSGTGYEMCRSVHAEMNAIINAARAGTSLLGADMFLFTFKREGDNLVTVDSYPCLLCKKMIINAGISRFVGNDINGDSKVYQVSDWVNDWQTLEDLTKDKDRYHTNYYESDKNQ
ncbi:MAG: dCMP deaminase family protein [Candidatus Omnitrophota bacterium]